MTQFLLRMPSKHMRTTRRSLAQSTSSSKSSMVTLRHSTWWAWQGSHGTCGIWHVTSWFNHFHLSLGHLFVDKEKTESSCHMTLVLYRNCSSPLPGLVTSERKSIHTTLGWFFVEDFTRPLGAAPFKQRSFCNQVLMRVWTWWIVEKCTYDGLGLVIFDLCSLMLEGLLRDTLKNNRITLKEGPRWKWTDQGHGRLMTTLYTWWSCIPLHSFCSLQDFQVANLVLEQGLLLLESVA